MHVRNFQGKGFSSQATQQTLQIDLPFGHLLMPQQQLNNVEAAEWPVATVMSDGYTAGSGASVARPASTSPACIPHFLRFMHRSALLLKANWQLKHGGSRR
jgi:hypothetical protein